MISDQCLCPIGTTAAGDQCLPGLTGFLGSDWHPDPDGDGIATSEDLCPYAYDPKQVDTDGDGEGDMCDPDAAVVGSDGGLVDFRAEHVTPYGAWLAFTSAVNGDFGWDAAILWSTNRSDLETVAGISALLDQPQGVAKGSLTVKVQAPAGYPYTRPVIVTNLAPETTYYLTARHRKYDGPSSTPGRIIEIKTHAAPVLRVPDSHPRATATAADLAAMKTRAGGNDSRWAHHLDSLADTAVSVGSGSSMFQYHFCPSAGLAWQGTGKQRYLDSARTLIDSLIGYYRNGGVTRNLYRWADASLGICADLVWSELSTAKRNEVVKAMLDVDDLNFALLDNGRERFDDTDETASSARTRIINGIIACDDSSIAPDLSARACEMLDHGLRFFFGVQLVKARRDRGYFAQSGGHLPDGAGYGQGTLGYWMETFHTLTNVGVNVSEYGPFVLHGLFAHSVYSMTPKQRGLAAFGDISNALNDQEPGGMAIEHTSANLVGLIMSLLQRWEMPQQAGWAAHQLRTVYSGDVTMGWETMLFDSDDTATQNYREQLPTAYSDTGMGFVYDRSSWQDDASFFVFQAGWTGVDHSHSDIGTFSLYRKGSWITHDVVGNGGEAEQSVGNNVPQLETFSKDGSSQGPGQFITAGAGHARIAHSDSGPAHTFVAADLTPAYNSHRSDSYAYKNVQRHVVWLKPSPADGSDRLVIFDLVDNADGASPSRGTQMHFDALPQVSGAVADVTVAQQQAQITVALPSGANMTTLAPTGPAGQYPSKICTDRLAIDPGVSSPALRMVTVMRVTDSGAATVPAQGIEADLFVGSRIGADVVLFAKDAKVEELTQSTSVEFDGELPLNLWWSGLTPDAEVEVTASTSGGKVTLTIAPGSATTVGSAGLLRLGVAANGNVTSL